jgi:hypothetical protein
MDELQKLKDTLNKAGFSHEALGAINEILDEAINGGGITQDQKDKLLAVIDTEIDLANIEADAMEEVAAALETFANEVDGAVEAVDKELEGTDKTLMSDIQEEIDEASAPTQ